MIIEYIVCCLIAVLLYCVSILLNAYSKEKELSYVLAPNTHYNHGGLYYINLTNFHLVLMVISIVVVPAGIACSLFMLIMTIVNAIDVMQLGQSDEKAGKLDKIIAWLSKPL